MNIVLITCNIRFDNPADGVNAWQHRRDFLAEILLSHSPDIIATQEGRFTQLKDLGTLLPEFEIVDQHRCWIKERMYPTLFIRKNKFELIKSDDAWLSETPEVAGSRSFGSAFPRLMTWAQVQLVNSEQKLLVINTHLDHVKAQTRNEQIKVLVNEVKKIKAPESSLVLMGDFNDSPESQVRKHLEEEFPGLQDAWKINNQAEETSHHSFSGKMPTGSRIDWILLDQKVKVEKSFMDKSAREGRYPTDHFPVVCEIKL